MNVSIPPGLIIPGVVLALFAGCSHEIEKPVGTNAIRAESELKFLDEAELKKLASSNLATRLQAVKATAVRGGAVVPDLVRVLESSSSHPLLCLSSVETLGSIGPQADLAVPAIIHSLRDEELRESALWALGEIGPKAAGARESVLKLLENADGPLKARIEATLLAFERLDLGETELLSASQLEELLIQPQDPKAALIAWHRVASLDRRAAPAIANLLIASSFDDVLGTPDMDVLLHATRAIGSEGRWLIWSVGQIARFGNDHGTRLAAVRTLGAMGREPLLAESAAPLLIEKLYDQPIGIDREAASQLKCIGLPVVPILTQFLTRKANGHSSYDDESAKQLALSVLAEIGPPAIESLPIVESFLQDSQLLPSAVHTIVRIAPSRAYEKCEPFILKALNGDVDSQRQALQAIHEVGRTTKLCEELLVELLLNDESTIANESELALSVRQILLQSQPGSPSSAEKVAAAIQSSNGATNRRAMLLAGTCGNHAKSVIPVLLGAMRVHQLASAETAPDGELESAPHGGDAIRTRLAAIEAPELTGAKMRRSTLHALSPCQVEFGPDDVRRLAAESLSAIGPDGVDAAIIALNNREDRSFRILLAHALQTADSLDDRQVSSLLRFINDADIGIPIIRAIVQHADTRSRKVVTESLQHALLDPERVLGAALILQETRLLDDLTPAIEPLFDSLRGRSAEVLPWDEFAEVEILDALIRQGDGMVLPTLMKLLRDDNFPHRSLVLGFVAKVGAPAVPALAEQLTIASLEEAVAAAEAMTAILSSDPSIQPPQITADLLRRLESAEPWQQDRLLALIALLPVTEADWSKVNSIVFDRIKSGSVSEKEAAVQLVSHFSKKAAGSRADFVALLADDESRYAAAFCLFHTDPTDPILSPIFVEMLRIEAPDKVDDDWIPLSMQRTPSRAPLFEEALYALAVGLEGPARQQSLRKLLAIVQDTSEPQNLRLGIAKSLPFIDAQFCIERLLPVLTSLPQADEVRQHGSVVGQVLNYLWHKQFLDMREEGATVPANSWTNALPALLAFSGYEERIVRLTALKILAELTRRDANVAPVLKAALKSASGQEGELRLYSESIVALAEVDENPSSWAEQLALLQPSETAQALLKIGEPAVVPMSKAFADSQRVASERGVMGILLGQLGSKSRAAIPRLIEVAIRPNDKLRWRAVHTLGLIGQGASESVPVLARLLEDKSPTMRVLAATSLGEMGDAAAAAVPALVKTIETEDEDLRWYVIVALGKIGPAAKSANPSLNDLLDREALRYWGLFALAQIDAEDTVTIAAARRFATTNDVKLRELAGHILERAANEL